MRLEPGLAASPRRRDTLKVGREAYVPHVADLQSTGALGPKRNAPLRELDVYMPTTDERASRRNVSGMSELFAVLESVSFGTPTRTPDPTSRSRYCCATSSSTECTDWPDPHERLSKSAR